MQLECSIQHTRDTHARNDYTIGRVTAELATVLVKSSIWGSGLRLSGHRHIEIKHVLINPIRVVINQSKPSIDKGNDEHPVCSACLTARSRDDLIRYSELETPSSVTCAPEQSLLDLIIGAYSLPLPFHL